MEYQDALARVIRDVVAPNAAEVDRAGVFPRAAVDAPGDAGIPGLASATDVGGGGQRFSAPAHLVARPCAPRGSLVTLSAGLAGPFALDVTWTVDGTVVQDGRVLPAAPEDSLFLLKASGSLPHGGGVRPCLHGRGAPGAAGLARRPAPLPRPFRRAGRRLGTAAAVEESHPYDFHRPYVAGHRSCIVDHRRGGSFCLRAPGQCFGTGRNDSG